MNTELGFFWVLSYLLFSVGFGETTETWQASYSGPESHKH